MKVWTCAFVQTLNLACERRFSHAVLAIHAVDLVIVTDIRKINGKILHFFRPNLRGAGSADRRAALYMRCPEIIGDF